MCSIDHCSAVEERRRPVEEVMNFQKLFSKTVLNVREVFFVLNSYLCKSWIDGEDLDCDDVAGGGNHSLLLTQRTSRKEFDDCFAYL